MTSSSSKPAITLDQLIALNDEIAALVRAGVPLDRGLRSLGEDLPGRLGRFAKQLSERIARGESLTDALAEPTAELAATLPCGGRGGDCGGAFARGPGIAGRLAAAAGPDAAERRALADLSPALVPAGLGPVRLLGLEAGAGRLPFVPGTCTSPAASGSGRLPVLASRPGFGDRWCPRSCWCWPGCGGWGRKARPWRKASARLGSSAWIPGLGRMLRLSRTAVFVEVLKLLVENRVPLDQAVTLAAEAAGDAALSEAAEEFAAAIRRGEPGLAADFPGLPPLLSWLIAGGQRNDTLLPALRHAADDYQRRAQYQAELSRVMLPVFVTCSISARDRGRLCARFLGSVLRVASIAGPRMKWPVRFAAISRVGRVKRVPPKEKTGWWDSATLQLVPPYTIGPRVKP